MASSRKGRSAKMAPSLHHQRVPQGSPEWVSDQIPTPRAGGAPLIFPGSHAGP